MNSLRSRIADHLEADWPTTLARWDRLEAEAKSMEKEIDDAQSDSCVNDLFLDDRLPEPGSAICLAVEFDIPKILPAAIYHLSRLTTSHDWQSCHAFPEMREGHQRTARCNLLETKELDKLIYFKKRLSSPMTQVACALKCHKNCTQKTTCEEAATLVGFKLRLSADPLEKMNQYIMVHNKWDRKKLCKLCWEGMRAILRDQRVSLWEVFSEMVD